MKKVKILKLSLVNFKGIKQLEINLNDRTQVFGDNATGKTTLVDAFTWLLFGKDSTGRKEFSIKTLDSENKVIHRLDHEVTGTFSINGEVMTLKRIYREKWVTRRGSSESELQGHETLFFWNDVPMQAGEYQSKVDGIILEDTFKIISSPMYFNTLKWQDRRNILTAIAGNISDNEIAATRLDFTALIRGLGNKTIEEFKAEIGAKKKKLKDELKLIPARVDEVTRSIPEAKDWAWIEDEINTVKENIRIVDEQLQDASKADNAFYQEKQKRQQEIHKLKTSVSDIEFEGKKQFQKQLTNKSETIQNAKDAIEKINSKMKEDAEEIKRLDSRIKEYEKEQQQLRDSWIEENKKVFPGIDVNSTICPTCKQELPEATIHNKQADMLLNFNNAKSKRLEEIRKQGLAINPMVEGLAGKIKILRAVDYESQVKLHQEVISEWNEKHLESVQSILSGNIEYQNMKKKLEDNEAHPEVIAPVIDNSVFNQKKAELNKSLDLLKNDLTLKSQIEKGEQRKSELLAQEKSYSNELADLEQTEFIIEEFTRAKVDALEGKINSMFAGVRFRLFDTQLNGGLIECCDTLVNGVPWNDVNNAARINAGIEIINVLTAYYEQSAPIWIDNSESITSIQHTNSQRIELYVSEEYKKLKIA